MSKRATFFLILGGVLLAALIAGSFYYERYRVRTVVIATNDSSSESYEFISALQQVVEQLEPRLKISIVETEGSGEIMQSLKEGQADLGVAQLDTPVAPNVDALAILYPQLYQLIVPADSDIHSPADLEGKRVATSSKGGGTYNSLLNLLDYYGLTERVAIAPISSGSEREAAFKTGEVDAIFRVTTLAHSGIREFLQTTDARLIPFTQFEAMRLYSPTLSTYTIPLGTYRAANPAIPDHNLKTLGVPTVLFVNDDVDATVVESLTRILFENKNDIAAITPLGSFISMPDAEQSIIPKIHPGARAYYDREKPSFFERNYDKISVLLAVIPFIASVYLALRARLLTRQRDRAYRYNLQMATLLTQMLTAPSDDRVRKTEFQLLQMLEDVIHDMNDGEVDIGDLQAFSFVWDKAMEALRYRNAMLKEKGAVTSLPETND